MQKSYQRLLDGNRNWVKEKLSSDPDFFTKLSKGQSPEFLWIGCSDSRVPANEITGTQSGDIFVHRNIANVVVHTDFNLMSVLQYAVEILKVKHIIVCGHYGCGGVNAAMDRKSYGLVNQWLRNIAEVYAKYSNELGAIENKNERSDRLVELNVIEQVKNLAKTAIVQKAWKNHQLEVHGWVYGLDCGLIKDLNVIVNGQSDIEPIFRYELESF
jgi:carbonic anhydrase